MATIALYASKINQMPGLISDVKKAVTDYNSELSTLRCKTLRVNQSVCNMDDIISEIQTSTQTQEQKIASLETFSQNMEDFITEVVRVDSDVADVINQLKSDFYTQYNHLKPECEKGIFEQMVDAFVSAWEWCAKHWKLIVTVVLFCLAAIAIIAITVATGGAALTGILAVIVKVSTGLMVGAVTGGLMGGIMSLATGGNFFEGFENGSFYGAISGAFGAGLTSYAAAGVALSSSQAVIVGAGSAAITSIIGNLLANKLEGKNVSPEDYVLGALSSGALGGWFSFADDLLQNPNNSMVRDTNNGYVGSKNVAEALKDRFKGIGSGIYNSFSGETSIPKPFKTIIGDMMKSLGKPVWSSKAENTPIPEPIKNGIGKIMENFKDGIWGSKTGNAGSSNSFWNNTFIEPVNNIAEEIKEILVNLNPLAHKKGGILGG